MSEFGLQRYVLLWGVRFRRLVCQGQKYAKPNRAPVRCIGRGQFYYWMELLDFRSEGYAPFWSAIWGRWRFQAHKAFGEYSVTVRHFKFSQFCLEVKPRRLTEACKQMWLSAVPQHQAWHWATHNHNFRLVFKISKRRQKSILKRG